MANTKPVSKNNKNELELDSQLQVKRYLISQKCLLKDSLN